MAILPIQLARVSNLLRTNVAHQTIARTQQQLIRVQNELSSGKRLNSPSDDPGDASIVQQLQKTVERRAAYSDNLKQATCHLSEVDGTLADAVNLLEEARQIASANVGSDVIPGQRQSAAEIVTSIFSQMLNLANKEFVGMYIFGGDRSTAAPFVEAGGGVKFVGSGQVLQNTFDESTNRPFMVDGGAVFGALSTRIKGSADLSPSMTVDTRLCELNGAQGQGIRLSAISLSNGSTTTTVNLAEADTVGDVIDMINGGGVGSITASIAPDGNSLQLVGSPSDDISVNEVAGGSTASDLGIYTVISGGPGGTIDGGSVQPRLSALSPLGELRGGLGIDLNSGMVISNGQLSATVSFSSASTVEDLMNQINGAGVGVLAKINDTGTGIDILNAIQGTTLSIAENGGSTASDLGVRSFWTGSPLSELNFGAGVHTIDGADFRITRRDGSSFEVDLVSASTVADVISAINIAAGSTMATFASVGNGIVLSDASVGTGTFSITSLNFSSAVKDLGLDAVAVGDTITGKDVNAVQAGGVFANLAQLRDALLGNNGQAITAAAEGLKEDYDRMVRIRGQTGARVQEFEARQNRLEEQNLATTALLSQLADTDFTEAIARFQTLQDSLQATLQTSSSLLNLSLLDFLS